MHSWRNFKDKVKRYWPLDKKEKRDLIITTIVLAFIFSFREWGTNTFDPTIGLRNFLRAFILVGIILTVRELSQRTIATWLGYQVKYSIWKLGLVIALVIAFFSNGAFKLAIPGIVTVIHLEAHRLGKFHYSESIKHIGWIAMSGPIGVMLFAIISKTLSAVTGLIFFERMMSIAVIIALVDMFPIPPLNGSKTFYGSRYIYIFVAMSLLVAGSLVYYMGGILPVLAAILFGAIATWIFFAQVDKRW